MTNIRLYNETTNGSTTSGAYYFNIHGNDGFMCDSPQRTDIHLNQHAANLLCQSLGHAKAEEGKGIGWFNKGERFVTFMGNNY